MSLGSKCLALPAAVTSPAYSSFFSTTQQDFLIFFNIYFYTLLKLSFFVFFLFVCPFTVSVSESLSLSFLRLSLSLSLLHVSRGGDPTGLVIFVVF